MAGVRWYFGANKPLQSRHREDDPLNMLIQGGSSAVSGTGGKSLGGTRGSGKSGSKSGTSGPVGGGAGGGCFIAGSQVLMKDGSIKPIEEVQIGEMVRGADGAANRVEKLIRPKLGDQLLYSINGGAHFVTDDHPFMTKAGWKAINPAAAEKTNPGLVVGALAVGDVLLTENGETPVQSIGATTGAPETQLYNFTVSGNRTFFIRPTGGENFLLVHNKGCFIAGTEVLMEDGSFKVIENVQIGDKLLGADGIYNEAIKVSIIAIGERKLYSVNGSAAFVTDSHPLMTTDGWKSLNPDLTAKGNGSLKIGKLSIGDAMVTRAGYVRVELLELQEENSDFMVVDLKVSGNGTYYVKDPMTENEFLAHNE
jgi:hypothetical protein